MVIFVLKVKPLFRITAFHTSWKAKFEKDRLFTGESHNFWEMVYVTNGKLCVAKEEKVYELEPGNALFFAPMEFHSIWNHEETPAEFIILSFSFDRDLKSSLSDGIFKISKTEKKLIDDVRSIYKSTFDSPDKISSQLASNRMEELILLLLQTQQPEKKYHVSIGATNYNRIISFLLRHLEENLSTEEIAKECSLSVSNLKKTFRKYSGMGIIQYYNEQRMILATSLIKENMSFSEVSERLNFSSQNYFTETFKRHMKMTPMQYKKSLEKQPDK